MDGPKNVTPEWKIEYSTFKADKLLGGGGVGQDGGVQQQPLPVPKHLLPEYDAGAFDVVGQDGVGEDWEVELDGKGKGGKGGKGGDDKLKKFKREMKRITPWKMKDLTIGSYVKLARKLVAEKKMWKQFSDFM